MDCVLEYACRVYRPHIAYEYQPFSDGIVVYLRAGGVAESTNALDNAAIRAVSNRVAGGSGDGTFGCGHSRVWFDEFFPGHDFGAALSGDARKSMVGICPSAFARLAGAEQ